MKAFIPIVLVCIVALYAAGFWQIHNNAVEKAAARAKCAYELVLNDSGHWVCMRAAP